LAGGEPCVCDAVGVGAEDGVAVDVATAGEASVVGSCGVTGAGDETVVVHPHSPSNATAVIMASFLMVLIVTYPRDEDRRMS